jgi:hypothetical protein
MHDHAYPHLGYEVLLARFDHRRHIGQEAAALQASGGQHPKVSFTGNRRKPTITGKNG